MTEPLEDLIPRDLETPLKDILNQFSLWLDELVNFGTILIKWDIEKNILKDEDLPPILFLRNFIEQIDAISVLVTKSSIEPCKTILRTAIENLLYLEYLFEKDTYNRSIAFLVWNYVNNNKNLERLDKESEAFKLQEVLFLKDKLMKNSKPASFESAVNYLAIGKALLESPKYLSVKNEYDLTRKKLKNNMAWYSLFNGPRNLKDLAEKLNHYVLYDVFFKNYSASTHGVDIIQGKLRGGSNENLGILQLRNPANAQDIVYNCFNFCLLVYSNFLQTKLPEKQKEYDEWLKSIREIRVKLVSNKFISPINGC